MMEYVLRLALEAGAREVLSRSPWLFRVTPLQRASAAGFIGWLEASDAQSMVRGAVLGGVATLGGISLLWRSLRRPAMT
jgi:hypothetical protein